MKYWLYLSTVWIPIGRLYMTAWTLWKAGVTWKQLFTEKIYRLMLLESGLFGVATPYFNFLIRKQRKKINEA